MLRNTLTTLSLIGLLLSVAAWGVSYFRMEYYSQPHDFSISLIAGNLELYDVEKARNNGVIQAKREPGLAIHGFKDFRTFLDPHFRTSRVTHILLPCWIPVLSFAILPSLQIATSRRCRKRMKLVTCFPKVDPVAMRVSTACIAGKEAAHERQTAFAGTDHC